jgi:hypothetical protein
MYTNDFKVADLFVKQYLITKKTVDAMDNILEQIYHIFMQKMTDLELGNMLNDNDLCNM